MTAIELLDQEYADLVEVTDALQEIIRELKK